ncbi:XRE family transcriptional regulator [Albimonas sp. CAU 1670]|uniref:helix-turn-helix domain-containing protein n=1 Tax=Albimonas sp. CAU 1670 TaxID=3032599 RepID=UPI0023DADD65|nr:XRE family transcriptional regulator [Albimonas sp. CAU 1670]MDF2235164.1 XRE family transcriptional regulator [Albimonas sp. CAU 1670]
MTEDRGDRPPRAPRPPALPEAAAPAPAAAEPIPDARAPIGQQIRELRRARGLKLAELAAATGRSIGNLSEMERGKSPITIQSLDGIARALDVSLNWFFTGTAVAPPEERDVVVRRGARRELNLAQAGAREELLSPHLAGTLEMILTTFAPGASTGDAPRRRRGEEGGMVLSGRLELHADGRVHLLEEGDSFQLPGAGEHWCRNPGERDAVVMWVIAPADY